MFSCLRLGRNSLVGTTVRDPKRLPEHLAADEHHVDWNGAKGYVATTAAAGCILGVGLTKAADDEHLTAAYGEFAEEARNLNPEYAPKTVNTDGWAATQNAFQAEWHVDMRFSLILGIIGSCPPSPR